MAVIVVCLAISVVAPSFHKADEQIGNPSTDQKNGDPNSWGSSGLWEAVFTGAIALLALWQLWDNRRSNERQLRAYVYVSASKVNGLDEPTGRRVQIEIKNFGQTPAFKERFWLGVGVFEWPLATTILNDPPIDLRLGPEDLAPGRMATMVIPLDDLTTPQERLLRAGHLGIYAWGRVTYEDAFGRQRHTAIRLVCEGDGLRFGLMHATESGNESI
jgi:hypothetical protein